MNGKNMKKNLYGVKQSPRIVDIPMQQFIMIEGKGNPNDKDFQIRYPLYIL